MGRPRIVEVDYYDFKRRLRSAVDRGGRLEPTDKEAWKAYLTEHKISDVTMKAWGRQKFALAAPQLVVLRCGESWDGFYAFSDADEAALKWERDPD